MKTLSFFFALSFLCLSLSAQDYTFEKISQEPVRIAQRPQATGIEELGDTTFTIYANATVPFKLYFVHGEQYHHILNPNPMGLKINGQDLGFYCNVEMSKKISTSMFLDIYEFTYLGRKYLNFFSFREDCMLKGCRYRCFNVFDITDPNDVKSYSFASIFGEVSSFGDFNSDGVIDFVRTVPKPASDLTDEQRENAESYCLTTVYTMQKGEIQQLKKEGSAYYIFLESSDDAISSFNVIESDWFFPFKDKEGNTLEAKSYFPPYISFDPRNNFLYDPEGFRVEKRNWVVHVADFTDIDGALSMADDLAAEGINDVYVMIDQYNRDLTFMVMVGNYWDKEKTDEMYKKLQSDFGVNGKVLNIRKNF
ncbi:MAG: SPOR domain-containing protein [Bacteroidota bacterium]